MSKISFKDAQINQIYVTCGGIVKDSAGRDIIWGYERVRLLEKDVATGIFTIETPWGTKVHLPSTYPLYSTPETTVRSEHDIIRVHEGTSLQHISFDDALAQGLCHLEGIEPVTTDIDTLREQLIQYFSTPQEVTIAAKYFNLSYRQLYNHLKYINCRSIGGQIYSVTSIKGAERKTVVITPKTGN